MSTQKASAGVTPDVRLRLAAQVQVAMEQRARRFHFFPRDFFSDPAWDILLELYAAELSQHRVTMSRVSKQANVAATTAQRWIKVLECEGILARSTDPLDDRRVFVALTAKGSGAMMDYFRLDDDGACERKAPT